MHRGWPAVRASQLASQPKQLAGEQGEDRTQDRAGNLASQQNPDDARSLHAGRQRRKTRGAGGISDGARSHYECGAVICGLRFLGNTRTLKLMVGLGGLEPPTSPLSGAFMVLYAY